MSAKFIWVRNPTAINGINTTYVSLRGNDISGDGTAQNPYRSIAKATTVASANTNIMLDDGVWNEGRNGRTGYIWWGNGRTRIKSSLRLDNSTLHRIILDTYTSLGVVFVYDCLVKSLPNSNSHTDLYYLYAYNSIIVYGEAHKADGQGIPGFYYNCVLGTVGRICTMINSVIIGSVLYAYNSSLDKNVNTNSNLGINALSNSRSTFYSCINNASTGKTFTDYFNYIHPNVLLKIHNATIDEWLACDFTAKEGSVNIGAGINGANIGFNEGFSTRATNDENDKFKESNGAILRNIVWDATLNGYALSHKDKVCVSSGANTITLAADAESTDDYYNGLFVGITAGNGYGEIHKIIDYDGATKIATIDTNWTTQPNTESIYSITGTIDSAEQDFGRVIRVKRNWAFCANMASWSKTDDASYCMWKEFITSPLYNNDDQKWELRPCSNFQYEYSIDGTNWYSNAELIAGTDSENKDVERTYGNASESYVEANAKPMRLRYVKYHIHIGFNIGEDE